MQSEMLNIKIEAIKAELGVKNTVIYREILIGKINPINAVLIYINALANKEMINKDIMTPLMLNTYEDLNTIGDLPDYICKRYITTSIAYINKNIVDASTEIKRGKTILLLDGFDDFIIIDTSGGIYRTITEPQNEQTIRGSREGFVENIETNISILRRRIKDKNLIIENMVLGRKTQSQLSIIYMGNIADMDIVNEVKRRLSLIDVDKVTATGVIEQYVERSPYSPFPQAFGSERPDRIVANIMEGRIALILEGTPFVLTVPAVAFEFFQSVEDYYQRTPISMFVRIIRAFAIFIIITLPAIYLTLLKFNGELIPLKFLFPIIQSRRGIALTPFLEIISMELAVEFLREGGLRLPSKIGQTLSIVGGIIIGDAAIKSKVVSPATLLVVGVTVIATFIIPNYEMSLSIRLLRFPMLLTADFLGAFGIIIGWFIIIVHLCSLESFGVPYIWFTRNDIKDTLIRVPLWQMNKRPDSIPNTNSTRQTDFRKEMMGDKDE